MSAIAHSRRSQKGLPGSGTPVLRCRWPLLGLLGGPNALGAGPGDLDALSLRGLRRVSDFDVSPVFLQYFLSLPFLLLLSHSGICPDTPPPPPPPPTSPTASPSLTPVFTTLPPPPFASPLDPTFFFWMVEGPQKGIFSFFHKETQTFPYSDLGKYKGKIHPRKLLLTCSLFISAYFQN